MFAPSFLRVWSAAEVKADGPFNNLLAILTWTERATHGANKMIGVSTLVRWTS